MLTFTWIKNRGGNKSMLFKFWIRSDTVEDFILHIDADATHTFFQLHEAIQEECKLDPSLSATFFIVDEDWDKVNEIKMFRNPPSYKSNSQKWLMKNTRLNEFIKNVEDKLLYTYDIVNNKTLYLELYEMKMEQSINAPIVKLRRGNAPIQESLIFTERHSASENDSDSQHIFDDLGELEDLYQIYGEMSSTIL